MNRVLCLFKRQVRVVSECIFVIEIQRNVTCDVKYAYVRFECLTTELYLCLWSSVSVVRVIFST